MPSSPDNPPVYQLRFFFDYGSGGCLWPGNDAAIQAFGFGPLDADTYDLHGQLLDAARIALPAAIKERIKALDHRFSASLDQHNPGGPGLWTAEQWQAFHADAMALCDSIAGILGDDFAIVYDQA
jgi:hypothetical protein